jgi:hypothetical protein
LKKEAKTFDYGSTLTRNPVCSRKFFGSFLQKRTAVVLCFGFADFGSIVDVILLLRCTRCTLRALRCRVWLHACGCVALQAMLRAISASPKYGALILSDGR